LKWQTGQLSFAQATPHFLSVFTALENALRNCVPREILKQYRSKRDEFMIKFDEYRASITVNQIIYANNQSTISSMTQSTQIDAQLRERELYLRYELTL